VTGLVRVKVGLVWSLVLTLTKGTYVDVLSFSLMEFVDSGRGKAW